MHEVPLSCLGKNSRWQGNLSSSGDLEIQGRLTGGIDGARRLVIAEGAQVEASLTAEALHIQPGADVQSQLRIGPLPRPMASKPGLTNKITVPA